MKIALSGTNMEIMSMVEKVLSEHHLVLLPGTMCTHQEESEFIATAHFLLLFNDCSNDVMKFWRCGIAEHAKVPIICVGEPLRAGTCCMEVILDLMGLPDGELVASVQDIVDIAKLCFSMGMGICDIDWKVLLEENEKALMSVDEEWRVRLILANVKENAKSGTRRR